ncbi:hypothetical protein QBC37DRAFT_389506 [Rhypophila decipiens]|uniref:Uncharacterized protein n=1 Tax=Rhypophila decipiens TaxID=261697 RepID=A0AAN7B846_9PEZI|nr:hypothetical protein QBC37DRAFT_389506 [Rhypophila decipiens]
MPLSNTVLGANPLILAAQTRERGEAAETAIISQTNCSPEIFTVEMVDLASFSSVREFANHIINNNIPHLHVFQLAAGVSLSSYAKCLPSQVLGQDWKNMEMILTVPRDMSRVSGYDSTPCSRYCRPSLRSSSDYALKHLNTGTI